jgi:nucleotide-binding universal stress UspA family protein
MKTILVPAGGSETDQVVFETALSVAKPLNAHLAFLHIHLHAGEAAANTPHVAFARGAALSNALDDLTRQCETRANMAKENVLAFCRASNIELRDKPCAAAAVTAHYRTVEGDALSQLVFHARHHELIVMGRAKRSDGLPANRVETVLMESGRPLLIAPSAVPKSLLGTVMVCWKEVAHAARAVSAALPLLRRAGRVLVTSVNETADDTDEGVSEIVHELQWHGIGAGSRISPSDGLAVAARLAKIAGECGATMLVMGGYGHRPTREIIFGGCTQAALEADLPVFLLH